MSLSRFIAEMRPEIEAEIRRLMVQVDAAAGQPDVGALAEIVHQLKGVAAVCGLQNLTEQCRRVEWQIHHPEDRHALSTAIEDLRRRVEQL